MMAKSSDVQAGSKPWNPPMLEQLSVDLSSVRQKLAGKIDAKAVGAIS